MIDFSEIPDDGEQWELFARDFLQESGFFIEQAPDRGPDGGKDLLVTERLRGNLGNYEFRWLISCKHFAKSKKSVQEKDEINIQERLESYNADGFIGFYSTLASSGLNTRLSQLREKGKIKDYKIFDHKLIENYLLRVGYSSMMIHYMPNNYKKISPLRLVEDSYVPLKCQACGKDILETMYEKPYNGIVVFLEDRTDFYNPKYVEVYWCCKGECDRKLRVAKESSNRITGWEDIGDLIIPVYFLDWIFSHFNGLRNSENLFSDEAFENLKLFIVAISQRVLREMTESERERAYSLLQTGRL
jgi:hypothetical protein